MELVGFVSALIKRWLIGGNELSATRFEVARLKLEPGDLLVVLLRDRIPLAEIDRIVRNLREALPAGISVVILSGDIELATITRLPNKKTGGCACPRSEGEPAVAPSLM